MTRTFEDRGIDVENTRRPDTEVDPFFLRRWSPRAFDPEPLPEQAVETLFEAARWAPSCYNDQPWLFVYGTGEEERKTFLEILVEKNRQWAENAPVLAVLFARRAFTRTGKANRWAPLDCGAAWMSLTVQARMMGLYTHGMAGFSPARAYELLKVPEEEYDAMCAIAVGRYGDREALPEEVRAMEAPSNRKPLAEVAFKGTYGG